MRTKIRWNTKLVSVIARLGRKLATQIIQERAARCINQSQRLQGDWLKIVIHHQLCVFRRLPSSCCWTSLTGCCGNVWIGQRTNDSQVPGQWLSRLSRNQRKAVGPLPIRLAKTMWFFGDWNASRDQSPGGQVIQCVVPGWSSWSFLTDEAMWNRRTTVTFVWYTKRRAKPQTYFDSLPSSSSSLRLHEEIDMA